MKIIAFFFISLMVIFDLLLALGVLTQIVTSFATVKLRHLVVVIITDGRWIPSVT